MPRRPSSGGFTLSIDDDFDETQTYRVKLFALEEGQATYQGAKPGEVSITWRYNVYREDGTAFEDTQKGGAYEGRMWSSDSTFGTSKARGYIDAFLGHDTTDEEIDQLIDNGFAEGLVGKTARASFEIRMTADGNEQLRVLLLRPDKPSRSKSPAPAAPATQTKASAPNDSLEGDLPWDATPAPSAPTRIPSAASRRSRIDD